MKVMSRHLNADVIEQYVIGALDVASTHEVDRHVEVCAACASALAREARLELALMQVAAAPVPMRARRRLTLAAGATALLAAAAALVVTIEGPRPTVKEPPRLVRCADRSSAGECLAKAQYDGVLTIGPDNQVVVPRYDEALP